MEHLDSNFEDEFTEISTDLDDVNVKVPEKSLCSMPLDEMELKSLRSARKGFEAYAMSIGLDLMREADGEYEYTSTFEAWNAYKKLISLLVRSCKIQIIVAN